VRLNYWKNIIYMKKECRWLATWKEMALTKKVTVEDRLDLISVVCKKILLKLRASFY
jgi:hypothetical protein